ncbi:hypothetical protein DJ021_03910 [Phenylobacterium hankyongense]|uniref:DUF2306 domain-containing protein n=2 Tax=Phenylobacterium hankyongense TaxID=1813876 RepID=A0A328B1X9_9CAUL|nr:hypothetical protein DJ021_03910 [Phenylobacterium hankyongense]
MGTFYVWMAALFVLIAFSGFAGTYWLQLPAGTFVGAPLLHLHGILFSAWTLFFLSQTWLAASGQMQHHRAWGVAGVSLATAMVFVGFATAIASMQKDVAAGYAQQARAFAIVPISAAVLFAILVTWAVVTVKRPETHKRLMMLATMSILQAPIGRFFFLAIVGGGPGVRPGSAPAAPVATTIGAGLVVAVLILAVIIYDWRKRGRPHPVYLIGGAAVVIVELIRVPLAESPQWQSIAQALGTFGAYT